MKYWYSSFQPHAKVEEERFVNLGGAAAGVGRGGEWSRGALKNSTETQSFTPFS